MKKLTIFKPGEIALSDFLDTSYYSDRYSLANENFTLITKDNYKKLLEEIKSKEEVKIYEYSMWDSDFIDIENDRIAISFALRKDGNYDVSIYAKTKQDFVEILDLVNKYKLKQESDPYLNFSTFTINPVAGVRAVPRVKYLSEFKNIYAEFYPFMNVDGFIHQFLNGKENILILGGEPGNGKTKFANLILKQKLENEFDDDNIMNIAYVKNIDILNTDDFWRILDGYDFLILDDLDFLLSSREENREDKAKNQFLSHFLSFTDGVNETKTKIIITTNQPIHEIDNALLRPGRLFGILNFRPLTYEEAENIWKNVFKLDAEIFEEHFNDNEYITQAELGSLYENCLANREFKDIDNYLYDKSVNALHSIRKRVGLI